MTLCYSHPFTCCARDAGSSAISLLFFRFTRVSFLCGTTKLALSLVSLIVYGLIASGFQESPWFVLFLFLFLNFHFCFNWSSFAMLFIN